MKLRILSTVLLCLTLEACAYMAVDIKKPVAVGDGITVEPQIQWADAPSPQATMKIWTVDGFGLDELRIFAGIPEKAPLMNIEGVPRKDMVAYSATMLPDDVMELVASTLGKVGYQQIQTETLRPVPFGMGTGFRFDLSYTTKDGLQMKGLALFAQRRRKLDVFLYMAPAEYYFDRHADTVEKVFASVKASDVPDRPARKR